MLSLFALYRKLTCKLKLNVFLEQNSEHVPVIINLLSNILIIPKGKNDLNFDLDRIRLRIYRIRW